MATEMLETYALSCTKQGDMKNYDLKFIVIKGVKVTFKENGDVNEVHLNYDPLAFGRDYEREYSIKGALKVQFFQHQLPGSGKDKEPPTLPDPDIHIIP